MNEENAQTLGEKPSKKRRYRNHKDNLKKEANQAKTNLKAGESTQTAQDVEAKEQKKSKKRRKNSNPTIKIGGNEEWQKDMKIAIEANKASHELRLEPLKYLNSAEHKIIITPLGGLGEIGGNMTIFETNNDAIIIDIGMSFPTEGMHGVDILVPDFDYVRKIKNKIRGIIITHAHEDHIGAVPYFADSLEQVKELTRKVTEITHNHPEGIKGAQATAEAIAFSLRGVDKKHLVDFALNKNIDKLKSDTGRYGIYGTCRNV